jgi:uncharacterized protein YeaO (DUF488 family)
MKPTADYGSREQHSRMGFVLIKTKRVYETPEASDGYHVLVDRLWPRGVKKEKARLDEWLKDIAPSPELRTWFNHQPERWPEFVRRYREELMAPEKSAHLKRLKDLASNRTVTLLYGAREGRCNSATVVSEVLRSGN